MTTGHIPPENGVSPSEAFVGRKMPAASFFGREVPLAAFVEHFGLIDSTNSYARRLIEEQTPSLSCQVPYLIIADSQTSGRGREGRRWWTGPGSLAFSLLLDETAVPLGKRGQADLRSAVRYLGLVAALALLRSLLQLMPTKLVPWYAAPRGKHRKTTSPPLPVRADASGNHAFPTTNNLQHIVGLKWPNDLLVNGRKLAGILVELVAPKWAIIGVGVNTNCSLQSAPAEIRQRAVSLLDLTGTICDHRCLLALWLTHTANLLTTMETSPTVVAEEAHKLCVNTGEWVCVRIGGQIVSGPCEGIGHDGALLIRHNGELLRIYTGHLVDEPH